MIMSALAQYGLTVDPVADIAADLGSYELVVLQAYLAFERTY